MSLDFAKEPDQSPEPETLPGVRVVGDPTALLTALAEARAEFDTAGFNREGQSGNQRFKYADIGTLRDAANKALAAHGVCLTMFPCGGSVYGWRLPYVLSGHGAQIWGEAMAPALELKEVKSSGALVSYHERYVFQAVIGIKGQEPEVDDLPELNSNALNRGGKPGPRREPPPPRRQEPPQKPTEQPPPAGPTPQERRAQEAAARQEQARKDQAEAERKAAEAAAQAEAEAGETEEPAQEVTEDELQEDDPEAALAEQQRRAGPPDRETLDQIKALAQSRSAKQSDAIILINKASTRACGKTALVQKPSKSDPKKTVSTWADGYSEGDALATLDAMRE